MAAYRTATSCSEIPTLIQLLPRSLDTNGITIVHSTNQMIVNQIHPLKTLLRRKYVVNEKTRSGKLNNARDQKRPNNKLATSKRPEQGYASLH